MGDSRQDRKGGIMTLEKVDDHIKDMCKKDPKFKRSYKEFKEMLDIYRKGYVAEIEELQARAEKAEAEIVRLKADVEDFKKGAEVEARLVMKRGLNSPSYGRGLV